jgi:hypothetical protein
MQRFSDDGNQLSTAIDMSPNERQWVKQVREVALAVLDYKARPAAATIMLNEDIRLINDYGQLDLDRLLRKEIPLNINPGKLLPARGQLLPSERKFWLCICNGAKEVLDCREDFFKYYGCLSHDVTYLAQYDGVYVYADVDRFVPMVLQWLNLARPE